MKPDITEYLEYEGKTYVVNWFDLVDKELPNLKWGQVYAIGDVNGLVPIVHYDNRNDNLPGGGTELGESVEQTLVRELDEELKMKVVSWEPLGYQEWTEVGTTNTGIDLRVHAKLQKEEEFINDPGGSVIGHSLVRLEELNSYIDYHEIGDRIVKLAKIIREKNR
jgi:ADP-ribose pyrophosphatase YjhB (NUDIX family)